MQDDVPRPQRVAYALRLPVHLKNELARVAFERHRSLNAEIVWRLEQSLVKGRDREPRAAV